jgi:opacity protein-like surface antigen
LTPQFPADYVCERKADPPNGAFMILRSLAALAALAALVLPVRADQTTTPTLPSLALNPEASSPWTGLYVGSEVMAAFAKGSKPGFGGAAFAGYNHEFDNNLVIGVEGKVGYAPLLFAHGPYRGFNFAETSAKVGYDMGRFMPYLTAGVVLAKSNAFGVPAYTGATDSINSLFSEGGNLQAYGTVGAGFDYAVTNNLTVGMEVRANAGRGMIAP